MFYLLQKERLRRLKIFAVTLCDTMIESKHDQRFVIKADLKSLKSTYVKSLSAKQPICNLGDLPRSTPLRCDGA